MREVSFSLLFTQITFRFPVFQTASLILTETSESELPLPEIPLPQTYLPDFQTPAVVYAAAVPVVITDSVFSKADHRSDPVAAQIDSSAHSNPAWVEVVIRRPGTERLGLAIVGGLETSQKQKVRGIVVKEVR